MTSRMKAVVIDRPHHALYVDTDRPHAGEGQILVRVASVGICISDVELLDGTRSEAAAFAVPASSPCVVSVLSVFIVFRVYRFSWFRGFVFSWLTVTSLTVSRACASSP